MLTISDAAREYIREKGNALQLITYNKMSLCCGRIALEPSIALGKPKNAEKYILTQINQIDVYIPQDFHTPHPLRIELKTWWFNFKTLHLNGWKLA